MQKIVIIGGGASGLVAAITAKEKNNEVIVLERNSMCGKKILVTGNGKCNYWNSDQSLTHYHSSNSSLIKEFITEQIKEEAFSFFEKLGIYPKIKNGYYYPFSNQATTIRNALLSEINRKNIIIKNDFLVEQVIKKDNYFEIQGKNEVIIADKVIIATGSKASPKTGSDGIGYNILKSFGHKIIKPLPALVQLKSNAKYLKDWAGIRTDVVVSLYENNELIKEEFGEIQLTDYGISGICVFNLSRFVSIGLNENKQEIIKINFLPFINKDNYSDFITKICKDSKKTIKEDINGILNSKLTKIILKQANISEDKTYIQLTAEEQEKLQSFLTEFKVEITGTNSFEQAQVCTGGIPLTEINLETCESKLEKGLYIVGELLDIDGDCGGYNLGIAWMSAIKAGKGCKEND